jgi:hypothetical protein
MTSIAISLDVEARPRWSNDQPPIQRDLMVMESLLPGTYDNHE